MLNIKDKSQCCGCNSCASRCPKQCITLQEDFEGFRYPTINTSLCINCEICEKVCPTINHKEGKKPLQALAFVNPNESIRLQSSSGGAFTFIAEQIISEGGVVFGAIFDNKWEVCHTFTETKEGLAAFRGSKYVQSRIESAYRNAEYFLKAGRKVLFSGSPCQIAGLKLYLRKEYDNLITVDFICHGVPSPKVWRKYLEENYSQHKTKKETVDSSLNGISTITGISFRDKTLTGWKKYNFIIQGKSTCNSNKNSILSSTIFYDNLYMQAFLQNLILRPSCYACPSKKGQSNSDITLADFWGVEKFLPSLNDDKGVSLLLANSEKGLQIIKNFLSFDPQVNFEAILPYNSSWSDSAIPHRKREFFFKGLKKGKRICSNIRESLHPTFIQKIKFKIYKLSI